MLINVVARWGETGLNKLRGMYAFALWDTLEEELWLARDPYGIKPLYVSDCGGTLWFASQARALAHCAPVNAQRDAAALVGFYLWGHVPEPFSWWAGIRMFPPGHVQRIRAGVNLSGSKAFAFVPDAFSKGPPRPLRAGELHEIVLDSVRHHMVADVPVGIFLSSGVDFSVVAALAAELETKLKTITLAFDEYTGTPYDEAILAETVASALHSDHITVRTSRDEFEHLLDDFLRSMDQPTIDGLNTYLASRAATGQGLKVVLSGLGGDELFGSYPSFHQIPILLKWGRPIAKFEPFAHLLEGLLRVIPLPGFSPKVRYLPSYSDNVARGYLLRRSLHLENELEALLDESWLKQGLERLSTVDAVNGTVGALRKSGVSIHAQIAALEFLLVYAQPTAQRYRLVQHGARIGSPDAICRRHPARAFRARDCLRIPAGKAGLGRVRGEVA